MSCCGSWRRESTGFSVLTYMTTWSPMSGSQVSAYLHYYVELALLSFSSAKGQVDVAAFYDYGGSSLPSHYLWKKQQPAYFVHWGDGEPGEPGNRCATLRNDDRLLLTMADTPCSQPHYFICKIGDSHIIASFCKICDCCFLLQ